MENEYESWKAKVRSLYRPGSLKAVASKKHLVEVQNAGWNKSARIYVRLWRKKLHESVFVTCQKILIVTVQSEKVKFKFIHKLHASSLCLYKLAFDVFLKLDGLCDERNFLLETVT